MRKLLVSTTLTAVVALMGSAFACPAEQSTSADQLPAMTAAAPQNTPTAAPPATNTTTKPKTTESNTGG